MIDVPTKRCSKCGEVKPLSGYHKHKKNRDGASNQCKACVAQAGRIYRAQNTDKLRKKNRNYRFNHSSEIRQWHKQYYADHSDQIKASNKRSYMKHRDKWNAQRRKRRIDEHSQVLQYEHEYRERNRQRIRAQSRSRYPHEAENARQRSRDWARNNPNRVRQRSRDWRLRNPERYRDTKRRWRARNRAMVRVNAHRYLSRKQAVPCDFNEQDWVKCLNQWGECCAYCGSQQGFWNPITADHFIPLANPDCPGTIPENMLPACKSCNCSKQDADPMEWLVVRFGKRKAKSIHERIMTYFETVRRTKP